MSRCTHIGALLYLLEEVKFDETPKLHLSTTDTPCYWGGGQKSNHNPKPLGENDYERVFPENRYKDFNPIPERFQKTSDETNKDIDDFLGKYKVWTVNDILVDPYPFLFWSIHTFFLQ